MAVPIPSARELDENAFAAEVERNALIVAVAAALIEALALSVLVRSSTLPLVGAPDSVATQALIASALIALIVSPIAYWRGAVQRNRWLVAERRHDFRWSVVPITLGATMVSALAMLAVMQLLGNVFTGATLYRPLYEIALGFFAGAAAYATYTWLSHLNAVGLLYLSLIALFGTLFIAALRNANPYWWEFSFSHLGTTAQNSHIIFNWGLLLAGLLLLVWHQFFMADVTVLYNHGLISARTHTFIRISLIIIAISAAGVGVIRWGISPFFNVMHTVSASVLGVMVGILLLSMPWTMRFHTREFLYSSFVILAAMVLVMIFRVINILNLTGMQIFGFMLASFWLVLFMRNMELVIERTELTAAAGKANKAKAPKPSAKRAA